MPKHCDLDFPHAPVWCDDCRSESREYDVLFEMRRANDLKQRELDLRAMDMQRRADEAMMNMDIKENQIEEQLEIEKMKLENNEDQAKERIRIAEEKIAIQKRKKK